MSRDRDTVTAVTAVQVGKGPARDSTLVGKYRVEATLGFVDFGISKAQSGPKMSLTQTARPHQRGGQHDDAGDHTGEEMRSVRQPERLRVMAREVADLVRGAWKIRFYAAGRTLSEMTFKATSATPRGKIRSTVYADNAACQRAMAEKMDALFADGWVDTGFGLPRPASRVGRGAPTTAATKTKAKTKANTATKARAKSAAATDPEAAFARLVASTLDKLAKATSEAQDARIWRAAITAYGALKVASGGDRTENLVHFFAVDGIALDTAHPVVITKARATKARKARWLALLQAAR